MISNTPDCPQEVAAAGAEDVEDGCIGDAEASDELGAGWEGVEVAEASAGASDALGAGCAGTEVAEASIDVAGASLDGDDEVPLVEDSVAYWLGVARHMSVSKQLGRKTEWESMLLTSGGIGRVVEDSMPIPIVAP